MDCIFCKFVDGSAPAEKIWENEEFLAFLDIRPINDGHTLLIPKDHFEHHYELPDDQLGRLFVAAKQISRSLNEAFRPPRVGVVIEGFGVAHLHVHLIPLYQMGELDVHRDHSTATQTLSSVAERLRVIISAIDLEFLNDK
jgi:histidine triad (HIT) family protein